MERKVFIRKVIQAGLYGLLALLLLALANKVVTGKDCSACPGKGICRGKSDCNKY